MTITLAPLPAWKLRAACKDTPPEVFYPTSPSRNAYREALELCRACPVAEECLAYALEAEGPGGKEHRHGMFGGKTPRERANMAPPRRCALCGRPFVYNRARATCSDRCTKIRDARYQRDWQREHRSAGKEGRHGSVTMIARGCTCPVCRGRRRELRREARLAADLRSEVNA